MIRSIQDSSYSSISSSIESARMYSQIRKPISWPGNYRIKALFLLIVSALLSGVAQGQTPDQVRAVIRQVGGPERFISELATRTAKLTPRMIDSESELTGAFAIERTLIYYTRMVNYNKSDIADVAALRQQVFTRNAQAVCLAPIASILINEHAAHYKYMAYSKSREYLFEYEFDRSSCRAGRPM